MSGPEESIRERITAQFSYLSDRADIWRGLDLLLETDAYLNLGYSRWYQTHLLGAPQRRLTEHVGRRLAEHGLGAGPGATPRPILDIGAGRGGPAVTLAERFDGGVLGVDLVRYNARQTRVVAREQGVGTRIEALVGDATELPVASGIIAGAVAIDAFVYLPDRSAAMTELSRVLAPTGVAVVSDLVTDEAAPGAAKIPAFADAWDLEPPGTVDEYTQLAADAGLELVTIEDLTAHSVGRFRGWAGLYLRLIKSPVGTLLERWLTAQGLDPTAITTQIRCAHAALPALEHRLFVLRRPGS
ncbi:MAG: methylase involved in ubiquinone/menaquinone biosynthesis [halophilic archaeon J07HX5]|nr:MAG: methylase involved in ubiquinone/menaquinone biosynthesis [halophilic archaeon J07HX5]